MNNIPKDFDLKHQWSLFLERCGISAMTMPEDQHREMKRAFMGACGQMLILLKDDLGDYGDKYGDEKAALVLQAMLNQVGDFWQKETEKQSGRAN